MCFKHVSFLILGQKKKLERWQQKGVKSANLRSSFVNSEKIKAILC